MSDFRIVPELHVRVGPGLTLGSIDQATEFARGLAKQRNSMEWDGVVRRLEAVRTEDDARLAANALRGLLEAEDLLVFQADRWPGRRPRSEPARDQARSRPSRFPSPS